MSDAKSLGERLRKAREDADLSQTVAAERIGVHYITISRWENGRQRIRADDLAKAAAAYGVRVSDLADLPTDSSAVVSRETQSANSHLDYTPNPSLAQRAPPGAYRVVQQYIERLVGAGLSHERIDRLERMLLDDRWAGDRSGREDVATEAQWIERVELIWGIIREALATVGIFP